MNKRIIATSLFFAVLTAFLFASCMDPSISNNTDTSVPYQNLNEVTTVDSSITQTIASAQTTKSLLPFETTPTPIVTDSNGKIIQIEKILENLKIPLTNISNESAKYVESAETYIKKAIDVNPQIGDSDYWIYIEFPRVKFDTDSAKAFNEKMLGSKQFYIEQFKTDTEEGFLMQNTFTSKVVDNVLLITEHVYDGYQYSSAGTSKKIYYFDIATGEELSMAEYAWLYKRDLDYFYREALYSNELGDAAEGITYIPLETGPSAVKENMQDGRIYRVKYDKFIDGVTLTYLEITDEEYILSFHSVYSYTTTIDVVVNRARRWAVNKDYYFVINAVPKETSLIRFIIDNSNTKKSEVPLSIGNAKLCVSGKNISLTITLSDPSQVIDINKLLIDGKSDIVEFVDSKKVGQTELMFNFVAKQMIDYDQYITLEFILN